MAKKKKKKDTLSLVLLIAVLVGTICAIVGLFTDWFISTTTSAIIGSESSSNYGLFAEEFSKWAENATENGNTELFPISLVIIAGIGATVLSAVCLLLALLNKAGVYSMGGLLKLLIPIVAIVFGVLVFVFSNSYASSLVSVDLGVIVESSWTTAIGVYLTGIGSIVSGGAYLFSK